MKLFLRKTARSAHHPLPEPQPTKPGAAGRGFRSACVGQRDLGDQASSNPGREVGHHAFRRGVERGQSLHRRGERGAAVQGFQCRGLGGFEGADVHLQTVAMNENRLRAVVQVDVDLVARRVATLPQSVDRPRRAHHRERRLKAQHGALPVVHVPGREDPRVDGRFLAAMEGVQDLPFERGKVGDEGQARDDVVAATVLGEARADVVQSGGRQVDRGDVALREVRQLDLAEDHQQGGEGLLQRFEQARRVAVAVDVQALCRIDGGGQAQPALQRRVARCGVARVGGDVRGHAPLQLSQRR